MYAIRSYYEESFGLTLRVKKMSRYRLNWTILLIMALYVVSCATANMAVQKQQGEALRNLGEEYYKQGDYTSALKELLKAEALYPDDAFLQNDLVV